MLVYAEPRMIWALVDMDLGALVSMQDPACWGGSPRYGVVDLQAAFRERNGRDGDATTDLLGRPTDSKQVSYPIDFLGGYLLCLLEPVVYHGPDVCRR